MSNHDSRLNGRCRCFTETRVEPYDNIDDDHCLHHRRRNRIQRGCDACRRELGNESHHERRGTRAATADSTGRRRDDCSVSRLHDVFHRDARGCCKPPPAGCGHVRHATHAHRDSGGAGSRRESVGELGCHRRVHGRRVQAREGCHRRHRVVDPNDSNLGWLCATRLGHACHNLRELRCVQSVCHRITAELNGKLHLLRCSQRRGCRGGSV
mmetsp:Transcript_30735/g.77005  ORF Transcript_30735/g.77005 Transcript_30735/m.77005 type:complete len:211 (+) Transcript_30735:137-769(+)